MLNVSQTNTFVIPKNSNEKDVAWNFMKFLISDDEKSFVKNYNINSFSTFHSNYPINKNNFDYLYEKNYRNTSLIVALGRGVLDKHKIFLESNFNLLNVNRLDNRYTRPIFKNMYEYLYYDSQSLDKTLDSCHRVMEMYFNEN